MPRLTPKLPIAGQGHTGCTDSGVFAYNMTRDALTETALDECAESRIEIISDRIEPDWVNGLTGCFETEAVTYSV